MAINKKAGSQVDEAPAAVASMNPDNMLQGGLIDDFDGMCVRARLVPWDYEGSIDHHVLAVALTIRPEGDKEFVQHYSAGDLTAFVPSMDGKTSVDLDGWDPKKGVDSVEGVYALRVGKREQLNNNTNWAQFIGALIDAAFPRDQLTAAVTFMEGVYGHWNRIPQKKRSGIVVASTDTKARTNDILVITEIKEAPKGGIKVDKATPATSKATPDTASLDDKLREVVGGAVAAAGEGGLPKQKLASLAIKAFAGADKAKAVKRVNEIEFLESGETWAYDADAGLLIAV